MRLHCAGVRFLTGNEGAPVILTHPDAIRHPKGHLAYLDSVMRLLSSMRAICGIAIEDAAARLLQSDIMKPLPSSRIPPIHSGRPRSLGEVVLMGKEQADIDSFLREFLDEFYRAKEDTTRESMLHDEPPTVEDNRTNAYLAAVAEHLALRNKLEIPVWTSQSARFLKRPYFPCGLESLKASLIVESPVAFRRRLIFVGSDPLYRPRRER